MASPTPERWTPSRSFYPGIFRVIRPCLMKPSPIPPQAFFIAKFSLHREFPTTECTSAPLHLKQGTSSDQIISASRSSAATSWRPCVMSPRRRCWPRVARLLPPRWITTTLGRGSHSRALALAGISCSHIIPDWHNQVTSVWVSQSPLYLLFPAAHVAARLM